MSEQKCTVRITVENVGKHRVTRDSHLPKTECGCYYCLEVYDRKEVKEYVSYYDIAICPKCGVDSVCYVSDKDFLEKANERWFQVHKAKS